MRQKIYVTRAIPSATIEALEAEHDVTVNGEDGALSPGELRRNVAGCAAIVSLLTDRIDGPLLDAAGPNCRIVANHAVGTNNFDVPSATGRGVALTNTPGVLDDATATHTIALMLAMARRIPEAERFLREGGWDGWKPMFFIGADVDRRVLGITGAGRIGRNVARKARAFDMEIIYSDVAPDRAVEDETGARFVSKDELLARSDFLTLHVPLLPDTRHYIGARELGRMKPTAILINASRGPVVDERALVEALRERRIWGAALDVFEDEPELAPRPEGPAECGDRAAHRLRDRGDEAADGCNRVARRAGRAVRQAARVLYQCGGTGASQRAACSVMTVREIRRTPCERR